MATTTAAASAEPARERTDLSQLRDDLARSYAPANAHERMLVTQIAQSFLRLQRAQDAEARYFEKKDILEAIASDFDTYKALTRYVAECERAWRHAVQMLERTQSRRERASTAAPVKQEPSPRLFRSPEMGRVDDRTCAGPVAVAPSNIGQAEQSSRHTPVAARESTIVSANTAAPQISRHRPSPSARPISSSPAAFSKGFITRCRNRDKS